MFSNILTVVRLFDGQGFQIESHVVILCLYFAQ